MVDASLKQLMDKEYVKGVRAGIYLMEQKILKACETGNPIEIDGRVWYIQSDLEHLRALCREMEV